MIKKIEPLYSFYPYRLHMGSVETFPKEPFEVIKADFLNHKDSPLLISVTWNGDYRTVSESLEALSPRLFTGSGTEIGGSNPKCDASFSCKGHKSALRLITKIEAWYKKEGNKTSNLTVEIFPDSD